MNVILAMVMSADGKITAGNKTALPDWSSEEDQKYFAALKEKSRLIIMGRKTFQTIQPTMKFLPRTLRVVLTKNPEAYDRYIVPGRLEFTRETPLNLIKKLSSRGYRKALLVGGAEINALFFKAKLVSEMWLTIEPVILGRGKSLFSEECLKTGLRLQNLRRLNKAGTLLLKFLVLVGKPAG